MSADELNESARVVSTNQFTISIDLHYLNKMKESFSYKYMVLKGLEDQIFYFSDEVHFSQSNIAFRV